MQINQEMILLIIAIILWISIFYYLFLTMFRPRINVRLVKNYDESYYIGRMVWFPDRDKSILNDIIRKYYWIRKKPIPKPQYMPYRKRYVDEIQKLNDGYKKIIDNNPEIFGMGFRCMWIKNSPFDIYPIPILFLSPEFFKRNEYIIYGFPPIKRSMRDPSMDYWLLLPDMNLVNGGAKIDNMVSILLEETADNRKDIGDQVELGMLGDPEQVKMMHQTGAIVNPFVNEKSQVMEVMKSIKKDATKDEILNAFMEMFCVDQEDLDDDG